MNETKATRYQRLKRRAHVAGAASGIAMLAVVALTPAAGALAAWSRDFAKGLSAAPAALVALVMFVAVLVALWEIVALPAVLYLGLDVDRRFRAGGHTVESVLGAQARATLVAVPAALVAALIVTLSAATAGPVWWIVAGALLGGAVAAALHWAPHAFARVAGARPLERPLLVTRLRELARLAGVPARVYQWDSPDPRESPAFVMGVGDSRRVFVSSHMLRTWSNDEITVVVAHELAHHAHHDLLRTLALDAGILAFALGLGDLLLHAWGVASAADLASLPFLALVAGVVWFGATPARNALSRAQEARADRFALSLTGGADAFDAAIRRLSAEHLAEDEPSRLTRWLFHRHPPVSERLALAAEMRRASGTPPPPRRISIA